MKKIIVTGGAGFIGSAVIRHLINQSDPTVINLDKLAYEGNLDSLKEVDNSPRYHFELVDICDTLEVQRVFDEYQPDIVMDLAAESHVDRSIDGPAAFIQTNIIGTYTLLDAARNYWKSLPGDEQTGFRFHHISTDKVYCVLGDAPDLFTESTPYEPSSPYSASKASADHLVRAWFRTYGLPVVVTNCSNNYGPYQFLDKLITLTILNAQDSSPLPIYGRGNQVRDWLYVEDHARALCLVATEGEIGQTYNIDGNNEKQNICEPLEEPAPEKPKGVMHYRDLIRFVQDRPGHDKRYAIDASKIEADLGWAPRESFKTGLRKTVEWYLENQVWCERVQDGSYLPERLGVGA